jgi:hypothetical protein
MVHSVPLENSAPPHEANFGDASKIGTRPRPANRESPES